MKEKLINEIIYILDYFEKGLSDVESGCGEKQPMHNEIKKALKKLKKIDLK
jgi:molecular chaperone GrpE (heat shock protein)